MILAGDIGGTKTNLALFEPGTWRVVSAATFQSAEHPSLESIVRAFLVGAPDRPSGAAFGVAGPVRDGVVVATNIAWRVDASLLAQALGLASVGLVNDLEANALGIAGLKESDFCVLAPGEKALGNAAVIAAGTGLGEAGMIWDGREHHPYACEGGHADYAPTSELELELWRFLHARFGRVSYERVLSGPGLRNLYDFLVEHRRGATPAWLAERLEQGDGPAAIAEAALAQRDPLCDEAVALFVRIYGAEAGNLALKFLARGGVYVGGGIAPKLLSRFQSGAFLHAFVNKGRMRPLLEAMPVRVILNDKAALLGAARLAEARSRPGS